MKSRYLWNINIARSPLNIPSQEEENIIKDSEVLDGAIVPTEDRYLFTPDGAYHINPLDKHCKCSYIHL